MTLSVMVVTTAALKPAAVVVVMDCQEPFVDLWRGCYTKLCFMWGRNGIIDD